MGVKLLMKISRSSSGQGIEVKKCMLGADWMNTTEV